MNAFSEAIRVTFYADQRDATIRNDRHSSGIFYYLGTTMITEDNKIVGVTDAVAINAVPSRWTREQKFTAVSMAMMNTAITLSFGVIAPFFPREAQKKGATETEIGYIFGAFQLTVFIMSPIYGSFINHIGPKYMFLSGAFLCGGCNILFGFLQDCPDGTVFVLMCFLCRITEANGAAMVLTASFAIIAKQFPENVATALGTLELFSGIGMVLGPSVGGGFYAIGGYRAPFIFVGSTILCAVLVAAFTLPRTDEVTALRGQFFRLLKIPGCMVCYLTIIGCAIALSFLDPTFSIFMFDKFDLPPGKIGLIFMAGPGLYALSSPLFGWMSDKGWQGSLVVCGNIVLSCSFLLLGPSPLLQSFISTTLVEIILSLLLLGVGVSMSLIPLFPLLLRHLRNAGFDESLATYGLVSGFFNSGFALGAFIGPTSAGYLSAQFGFEWSTSICGFIILGLGLLLLFYISLMRCRGKWPLPVLEVSAEEASEEKTPLTNSHMGPSTSYGCSTLVA